MLSTLIQAVAVFPFIGLVILAAGSALAPAIWTFHQISAQGADTAPWLVYLFTGVGAAAGFYVYGFSLILVAPLLNFVLRGQLKAWRGPAVSLGCLPWYIHNTLTLLPRYSFLEFVTPTEFSKLFYRLMGMKVGRNVTINTTAIADPSLIRIEDNVTIGGSANIMAHYSQSGFMVIAPVIIRRGATIGLRATLMGGIEVGEKAKVLANSFVLPNTKIPAGETWGGIPAARVEIRKQVESSAKAASS